MSDELKHWKYVAKIGEGAKARYFYTKEAYEAYKKALSSKDEYEIYIDRGKNAINKILMNISDSTPKVSKVTTDGGKSFNYHVTTNKKSKKANDKFQLQVDNHEASNAIKSNALSAYVSADVDDKVKELYARYRKNIRKR